MPKAASPKTYLWHASYYDYAVISLFNCTYSICNKKYE